MGLRWGSAWVRPARRMGITSGTRSSRRPGSVPSARVGRFWLRTSCGLWPEGGADTNAGRWGLLLKGLPDPVETVEVLWEPLGAAETAAVPLPGRLAVRPAVGVVGRETEMAAITDATKRVAEGEGREILLISGEAGLGKTTLVAEAARSAFDPGPAFCSATARRSSPPPTNYSPRPSAIT